MAAGSTYSQIATTTIGSTTSSYTFSNIPQTYTNLVLVSSPLTSSTNLAILIQLNSDTGSNYSRTFMSGNGSSTSTQTAGNLTEGSIGFSTSNTVPYPIVTQFAQYSNTTTFKTYLSRSSSPGSEVLTYVNLWRSTAAINSIKLYPSSGGSFTSGTTLSLYGIKGA